MKPWMKVVMGAGLILALAGCVVVPQGPTYPAMPGSGKTYEQFVNDDLRCRDIATAQVGSSAANANNAAAGSAVAGTLIGAAAGLAMGGNSAAAGVGAGMGLLAGSAVGASTAQTSYYATQRSYDIVYTQCMYAAGNRVAVPANAPRYQQQPYPPVTPPNAPPGYNPYGSIPPPNAPLPR